MVGDPTQPPPTLQATMTIDSDDDIEALRRIGGIVARTLQLMQEAARPGMTTAELDALGAAELARHGARSAPQLTYRFPGATCISVNEEVAHGIPGSRVLCAGDLVNIDVSAELDGYFGDTGGSFVLGEPSAAVRKLCDATRAAMNNAIAEVSAGVPFNAIGRAISSTASRAGFRIIRSLCSHGVGRALHEDPEYIFPFEHPAERRRLRAGQVITIEPFLSTRAESVKQSRDGWTLFAPKGNRSAQYEHTLIVTDGRPIITTLA